MNKSYNLLEGTFLAAKASGKDPREVWLTEAEVGKVCPPCAAKMKAAGMVKIRLSQIAEKLKEQKISAVENLIKSSKLSQESLKKIKASLSK